MRSSSDDSLNETEEHHVDVDDEHEELKGNSNTVFVHDDERSEASAGMPEGADQNGKQLISSDRTVSENRPTSPSISTSSGTVVVHSEMAESVLPLFSKRQPCDNSSGDLNRSVPTNDNSNSLSPISPAAASKPASAIVCDDDDLVLAPNLLSDAKTTPEVQVIPSTSPTSPRMYKRENHPEKRRDPKRINSNRIQSQNEVNSIPAKGVSSPPSTSMTTSITPSTRVSSKASRRQRNRKIAMAVLVVLCAVFFRESLLSLVIGGDQLEGMYRRTYIR